MFYRQCKLRRGELNKTSWIPEFYVKQGKFLELKKEDAWDDGWEVIFVSSNRLEESQVIERSLDYRRTREASDI